MKSLQTPRACTEADAFLKFRGIMKGGSQNLVSDYIAFRSGAATINNHISNRCMKDGATREIASR